jgi:hypothetical protein
MLVQQTEGLYQQGVGGVDISVGRGRFRGAGLGWRRRRRARFAGWKRQKRIGKQVNEDGQRGEAEGAFVGFMGLGPLR